MDYLHFIMVPAFVSYAGLFCKVGKWVELRLSGEKGRQSRKVHVVEESPRADAPRTLLSCFPGSTRVCKHVFKRLSLLDLKITHQHLTFSCEIDILTSHTHRWKAWRCFVFNNNIMTSHLRDGKSSPVRPYPDGGAGPEGRHCSGLHSALPPAASSCPFVLQRECGKSYREVAESPGIKT